ncbi:MAG: hypothetical protein GY940_15745 [bacterium]|nr:hypothetical protein [bacterium]
MSDIRYLLDENMPHAVRDQLLYHEPTIEVLCIGDGIAPSIGTPDPVILEWMEENGYILVTRNRSTMPSHLPSQLLLYSIPRSSFPSPSNGEEGLFLTNP